jgi:hypothetical protein
LIPLDFMLTGEGARIGQAGTIREVTTWFHCRGNGRFESHS